MEDYNRDCIDCGNGFDADFDCQQRCPKCRKKYFKANPDKKKIADAFIKKQKSNRRIYPKLNKISIKAPCSDEPSPCLEGFKKHRIGW